MMRVTTAPSVFLIGFTTLDQDGLNSFLKCQGANEYELAPDLQPAEELVRTAGKACYRSYQPDLNKNLTRVRTGGTEYIRDSILAAKHGSVLEHASITFAVANCSRVFTHELVRHRAGTAFSQESLRYVRGNDIAFYFPPELKDRDSDPESVHGSFGPIENEVNGVISTIERAYTKLEELSGIDKMKMKAKKIFTSALRRILPMGMSTNIIFTANIRALRHMILMRTDPSAEVEIRLVFDDIARMCKERFPAFFCDFYRQDDGQWICRNAQQPYDKSKAEWNRA